MGLVELALYIDPPETDGADVNTDMHQWTRMTPAEQLDVAIEYYGRQ